MWYISITEYYSFIKKEGNPTIHNDVDESGRHYAKWNKPEKEKYCMILLIYGL